MLSPKRAGRQTVRYPMIRVSLALYRRLHKIARREDRSVRSVIEAALKVYRDSTPVF